MDKITPQTQSQGETTTNVTTPGDLEDEIKRLFNQIIQVRKLKKKIENEDYIRSVKQSRKNLDDELQNVKNLRASQEVESAVTKIQEGIMWLGMELKRIGSQSPYPEGYNANNSDVGKPADGLKL